MADQTGGGHSRRRHQPAVPDAPLHRSIRSWPWAPWLLASMVLLRLVAVVGIHLYRYFDSAEYDIVDFTGRSRRPWATPLFYALLPDDPRAMIVTQALLGAVAWTVLALTAAAWFRHRHIQIGVAVTIAMVGLTTSVTNWDTTKLSESLALSLTMLVLAAWLNLVRRPALGAAALLLAVSLPWVFVRQSLMPTVWILVLAASIGLVWTWVRRGRRTEAWRALAVVVAGLALLCGVATVSYTRNQEIVRHNLTVIVMNRMAPDAERLQWFEDQGMPLPASGGRSFDDFDQDRNFQRWVADEGSGTYLRFLIAHPWYTATEPLDDFVYARPSYQDEILPQTAMLSPGEGYGSARPVIPESLEQILFGPGQTGVVLIGLFAVTAWSLVRWRWIGRRWIVPLSAALLAVAGLYAAWHGATPELPRLAVVPAVVLRIALVLQIAVLAEGELARRSPVAKSGS
ncbi:MAG: hypothetical protein ABI239_04570 [Aquihabitans sp.]